MLVNWTDCYGQGWKHQITPESFAHPAKASRALLGRIFDHLFAIGALEQGGMVLDPFGGVGTTGLTASFRGCRSVSCELEPTFYGCSLENIALHRRTWDAFRLPIPIYLNGDSRNLRQVVQAGVDAVISSPPYATIAAGASGLNHLPASDGQQGGRSASSPSQGADSRYGASEGQLARFGAGSVDAVVSSPPYADSIGGQKNGIDWSKAYRRTTQGSEHLTQSRNVPDTYGETDGQLGRLTTETFWSASREIIAECHAILKPGGYAVWIVKSFVRDKAIVDFPGDWRKLCEHVGFETMTEVHAMLVSETRETDMFGVERVIKKEKKSFFRRLAESKGSPKIDFETVWIMRKRLS